MTILDKKSELQLSQAEYLHLSQLAEVSICYSAQGQSWKTLHTALFLIILIQTQLKIKRILKLTIFYVQYL